MRADELKRARKRFALSKWSSQIVPYRYAPLKLRREPDEFWTEPRKVHRKVTLPKLKCLEDRDEA